MNRDELVAKVDELKFRLKYLQRLDDKALYDIDEMKKLPYEIAKNEDKLEKISIPEGQTQVMSYSEVQLFVEKQEKYRSSVIAQNTPTKDRDVANCENEVSRVFEQRNAFLKVSDISLKEFKDLIRTIISDPRTPLMLF